MNKDKIQVGDLVISKPEYGHPGVGLVMGPSRASLPAWKVYWLKTPYTRGLQYWYEHHLTKLSPTTQGKQNE